MNRQKLFSQTIGIASLIGSFLALYISLTTFWQMPHGLWLALHNLLVITSLVLAGFIGYRHRALELSFKLMLMSITAFFSVVMFLYIGSYAMTTVFFADQMVWIPFFYHDYNHHGFKSVVDYLSHRNNYRELLELQIFSFMMGSGMYFAAGSLGYGAKVMIDGVRKTSGTSPSAV